MYDTEGVYLFSTIEKVFKLKNIMSRGFFLLFCSLQVLGTPTREQIREMNPNYTEFKFPQIKAHPWTKVSQQVQEPFYFSKIHPCIVSTLLLLTCLFTTI